MAGVRAPRRGTQASTAPNTSRKWKKKVHRVDPGDIIQFRTNNIHMLGTTGTVIGYVTEHEVLIRTFGGTDEDYPPMYISVYDRQPNENHTTGRRQDTGQNLANYACYIQRVLYRLNPAPVKKRKRAPVRFLRVNPEALPDVLSGQVEVERGVHVVVDKDAPVVPEQIETPQS
jgi:hypothetical protein